MADRHLEIQSSYRQLGGMGSFYDGIITRSTLIGKFVDSVIWGLDKDSAAKWINDALAPIPAAFQGKLLEVPVGTGVLTMPLYRSLPEAEVTCLDYSADMMANARHRAEVMGVGNVAFVQGDVGKLPFADGSFDIVLSLNGFHAFPDKDAAYRETCRVLKPGGTFCGCFYVQGGRRRTDWFIRHIYQPKGFFTPPYETEESLRQRLTGLYKKAEVSRVEGIGCFRCVK